LKREWGAYSRTLLTKNAARKMQGGASYPKRLAHAVAGTGASALLGKLSTPGMKWFAARGRPLHFARRDEEPKRRSYLVPALAGVAAAGGVGAYLGVRKLRKGLEPAIARLPGTLDSVKAAGDRAAAATIQAAGSFKSATDSFRKSTDSIGRVAGQIEQSKGKTWLRRRLGFAALHRAVEFAYADALDKGWDVRDARGRSARVYAPGSRRRERRPKEWGEKTENIRAVRNVAIAGTVAGAVGAGYLLRKNSGLKRTVAAADQNAKTAVVKRIQAAQAKARDLKIKRTMREAAASPSANFPALRLA
jgi:hypothetical protein